MSGVQVKGPGAQRPVLSPIDQARREASTAYHMQTIADIAASGHPDDVKISYIRMTLYNWRSRMAIIDAGGY